jgi:pimeloyl-ACP methyl ester carboxylesterase
MGFPGPSTANSAARDLPVQRRFIRPWTVCGLALFALPLGFAGQRLGGSELRSYSLLAHFLNPQASGPILRWETRAVSTKDLSLSIPSGSVRARLYSPVGVKHPPGMVVLHGIHRLGIDEPRLMNFARAAAGSGFAVLTPEIAALADYRVDASAMAVIGESPAWLQERLASGPVTVVGISFAGGLALLAGCDSRYAPHMRALALMGPYDDLGRVSRFLTTSQAELPDGRWIPYAAHPYGAQVFVYDHLAQFFPAADLTVAHDALRFWLWEQPENALPLLPKLSVQARTTMQMLFDDHLDSLRPQMLQAIADDASQLAELSPQGRLANLHVPVFVLHGATDDIIPSTESLWLDRDIPAQDLRALLITPAFSHVDPEKGSRWYDELNLVNFMAGVLRASS